jgi:uncharacterized protein YcgI (DUF1989 family)
MLALHQIKSDNHHSADGASRIPPQSGTAFLLKKGQTLRVTDPMGEQVSDLFALDADDHNSYLSSGRTIDYASKYLLSVGDILYSNDSKEMLTIVSDTVKRHDFTLTPCSQRMFEKLYNWKGHHLSCFENLSIALGVYGVSPERIQSTFNIFMNVSFDEHGGVAVNCPLSKAGDFIELRAERDLLCGLTACSAEGSNNGMLKPIDFQIFSGEAAAL